MKKNVLLGLLLVGLNGARLYAAGGPAESRPKDRLSDMKAGERQWDLCGGWVEKSKYHGHADTSDAGRGANAATCKDIDFLYVQLKRELDEIKGLLKRR